MVQNAPENGGKRFSQFALTLRNITAEAHSSLIIRKLLELVSAIGMVELHCDGRLSTKYIEQ